LKHETLKIKKICSKK